MERGWSQDEFAFQASIDGRQVSRYENDRVTPSIEVVVKMAGAFGVSIDYLLLDDASRSRLERPKSRLAERVAGLGNLSEEDEKSLLHILEAIEAKNKLRALVAELG